MAIIHYGFVQTCTHKLKYIFFFILSFSLLLSYSQIGKKDVQGTWTMIKTDLADGSRLIPYFKGYEKHFNMIITKNKIVTDYHPAERGRNSTFNYKLKGNKLFVTKHLSFEIEKVNKDTLVIREKIDDIPLHQTKRYQLVKQKKIIESKESQYLGEKEIKADPQYTPLFNDNLELVFNLLLKGFRDNLKLKGTINLLIKEEKVDTRITFRDKVDPLREPFVVNVLDRSFMFWDISGFEKYEKVSIDFVLNMERTKTYRGLKMTLLASTFEQQQGYYGIPWEVTKNSNDELQKGIIYYNSNKFDEAIQHFSKSYNINPTLIDALYNRAATYHRINKIKKACEDWKELSDLGQMEGSKLYKSKCKIPNKT
jgi:tetratricopeptide (TPR) repeat protein